MIYLDIEKITDVNKYHIIETGGNYVPPDNLLNPGSLGWVLDAIQYPLYGKDLCPTLIDKAAKLSWTIIKGHVFHDGNKRTGSTILEMFLAMNGHTLAVGDDELIEVALMIARGDEVNFSFGEFVSWVEKHIEIQTS